MYTKKPALILFTLLVALYGCAGAPSLEAPEPELQNIPYGHGRIVVYRLHAGADRISATVRINRDPVSQAGPGSFFHTDLPVGEYEITAARNTNRVVVVNVEADATYYVRVDVWLRSTRWTLIPVLVPEDTAQAEMRGLSFAGSR